MRPVTLIQRPSCILTTRSYILLQEYLLRRLWDRDKSIFNTVISFLKSIVEFCLTNVKSIFFDVTPDCQKSLVNFDKILIVFVYKLLNTQHVNI